MGKEGVEELFGRVASLLHANEEAESFIKELLRKIHSLKAQCSGLKKQLRDQREHFEAALAAKIAAEKLVDDLKSENRTMRVVIRGFGLSKIDRIDDPLS